MAKYIYYDTSTTFLENSRIKKLRQDYCKKNKLEESKLIRDCVYKAINLMEDKKE